MTLMKVNVTHIGSGINICQHADTWHMHARMLCRIVVLDLGWFNSNYVDPAAMVTCI